jgi:hypothetical protein
VSRSRLNTEQDVARIDVELQVQLEIQWASS